MGTRLMPHLRERHVARSQPYVGAWHKVTAEGVCRFCGRPWAVRAPTRHHVVPQSWFQAGSPGAHLKLRAMNDGRNVVGLCRPCHDLVDNRDDDVRMEARRELRVLLTQAEVAHAVELRGLAWLNRNYPARPRVRARADVAVRE